LGKRKIQDIHCEIKILKDGTNFRDIVKRFHGGKEGEERFRAVLEKLNHEFFWGHYVIAKHIGKKLVPLLSVGSKGWVSSLWQ